MVQKVLVQVVGGENTGTKIIPGLTDAVLQNMDSPILALVTVIVAVIDTYDVGDLSHGGIYKSAEYSGTLMVRNKVMHGKVHLGSRVTSLAVVEERRESHADLLSFDRGTMASSQNVTWTNEGSSTP